MSDSIVLPADNSDVVRDITQDEQGHLDVPPRSRSLLLDDASSSSASSSSSSSSSCSSTFSERDDEWYMDVSLGFAKPVTSRRVFRENQFPSKVGGRPVWLYGRSRGPSAVRCDGCNAVLHFLLQVYAPVQELEHAFHRTLYIFVCRVKGCHGGTGSAKVLVAQLPRKNLLYGFYPLDEDQENPPVQSQIEIVAREGEAQAASGDGDVTRAPSIADGHVCALCGFAATARCGKCSSEWYCSRDCQRIDWRLGHKSMCTSASKDGDHGSGPCVPDKSSLSAFEEQRAKWLFKEFEVLNEPCPTPGGARSQASDCPDGPDLVPHLEAEKKEPVDDSPKLEPSSFAAPESIRMTSLLPGDLSKQELPSSMFKEARRGRNRREDAVFRRFSEGMRDAPSQILRYWRGGRVLWASREGRPENALESPTKECRRCGGTMVFEMQVLPQLLYYIGVDSGSGPKLTADQGGSGGLDWGTIAVYTCARSCVFPRPPSAEGDSLAFVEEIAWVQPLTQ